jgi:hypothetical protein
VIKLGLVGGAAAARAVEALGVLELVIIERYRTLLPVRVRTADSSDVLSAPALQVVLHGAHERLALFRRLGNGPPNRCPSLAMALFTKALLFIQNCLFYAPFCSF